MSKEGLKIGFLGAGNMARAIGIGLIKKKYITPNNISISAPSDKNFDPWKELGVHTTTVLGETVNHGDVIFLAFKPYQLEDALERVKSTITTLGTSKIFVSVMAGVTIETLENKIKDVLLISQPKIVRSMPNTPMQVGEGCCVISPNSHVSEQDVALVLNMFSQLGKCEVVQQYLIAPFTGLAGSGPAFIYMLIEAMSDGAVKKGLPRHMATTFAAQTVLGAAKMVLETKKHPGELKDDVCSPGGTTICGVQVLEEKGLRAAVIGAVSASASRAEEISRTQSDDGTMFQKLLNKPKNI